MMNIIPVSSYPYQSSSVPGASAAAGNGAVDFRNLFEKAAADIDQANAAKEAGSFALATGDADDLAAIGIDSQRAEISLQLLVQMRNKILESYQEIMRMNV